MRVSERAEASVALAAPPPGRTLDPEVVGFAALILLILAAVFLNSWGLVTLDTQPELYFAPGRTLIQALSVWEPSPFMGQAGFNAGLAPVAALVWFIRSFGTPVWLTIRIFRAVLLMSAALGAAAFYGELVGTTRRGAGRLAAATLYVANPYVLVSATSLPVLLPYALFPWLMLALARSVRAGGWKAPAAFALVFFAMGGMNGGIVPLFLLLGVPAYLLYERFANRVAWRRLLSAGAKSLGLGLLVSLYWIIPTVLARGTGAAIAVATERPEDVASTSSYAETLRLLGVWPLYGRQGPEPFLPKSIAYVTNVFVVAATFALPVAAAISAWLSRSRARALGAILVAVGAPIMVGLFPPGSPTPFGRTIRGAFDHIPGAIGFRTTNKAGALVALGLGLMVALGVSEVAGRVRHWRLWQRGSMLVAALVFVAISVYPAWTGNLYPDPWKDIPAYWRAAARDLDAGPSTSRVLLMPGETFANYRWGKRGPTDLTDALLSRPSVLRTTVPAGSRFSANFLAALDQPFADGTYRRGALPVLARYLGVRDVLVRGDLAWERWGGVRPAALLAILRAEPEVRQIESYGRTGENTVAPGPPGEQGSARALDAEVPPLIRYRVTRPGEIVRAEPASGVLLVDGDNFALPALAELGLLGRTPPFQFLASMDLDAFRQALRDGARIVLTDSNRRRAYGFRRTGANYSPTLPADEALDPDRDLSFGLFGSRPDTQTVALLEGAASVAQSGAIGRAVGGPRNQPEFAFDGDPSTVWLSSSYQPQVGQFVTIRFAEPIEVESVTLQQVLGPGRKIEAVRIVAGRRVVAATLPAEPSVEIAIPRTEASSVTVKVTGVRGTGTNPVGFREIQIPGVRVGRIIRLPVTFSHLAGQLQGEDAAALARTPLDIVLVRQAAGQPSAFDDEEPFLDRQIQLPASRDFVVSGEAALSASLPDSAIDGLVGIPPGIVAESSSRSGDRVSTRALAALDGDPGTAWIPETKEPGEFLDVTFPTQVLDHVVVHQDVPEGSVSAAFISGADLSVNGGEPRHVALQAGATRIDFEQQAVREIRLTITSVAGLGGPVRVSELDIPNVRVQKTDRQTKLEGCVPVASVDGSPVDVQLPGTLGRLAAGQPFALTPCGEGPLSLTPGIHRIRSLPGWDIGVLRLSSAGADPVPAASPSVRVSSQTPTRMTVEVGAAEGPYYLVTGQGFDPRWRATMDGALLGPPILLDGYSVGWWIGDPDPHTFAVSFAPQGALSAALLVSMAGLALVLAILLIRRRKA